MQSLRMYIDTLKNGNLMSQPQKNILLHSPHTQKNRKHTVCQLHYEVRFFRAKSEKSIGVFLLRNVPFPQQLHAKTFRIKSGTKQQNHKRWSSSNSREPVDNILESSKHRTTRTFFSKTFLGCAIPKSNPSLKTTKLYYHILFTYILTGHGS